MPRWSDHPKGLLARLDARIDRSGGPDACWNWQGTLSRGKGREVGYGSIKEGRDGTPTWRVNRLVLLREEIPEEIEAGEQGEAVLLRWLRDANTLHKDEEAAHTCDNARCCNPAHLEWAIHPKNVREGWKRKHARAQARTGAVA